MGLIYGNRFLVEENNIITESLLDKIIKRVKDKKSYKNKIKKEEKPKNSMEKILFIKNINSNINIIIPKDFNYESEKEFIITLFDKIDFNKEIKKEFKKFIKREFGSSVSIDKFILSDHKGCPRLTIKSSGIYLLDFNYYSYSFNIDDSGKIVDNSEDSQYIEEGWYIYFDINNNKISKVESNFID